MNKKKKIVLYAGVLIALVSMVFVASAGIVEHNSVLDGPVVDSVVVYPVLSERETAGLMARLLVFEARYNLLGFEIDGGCNRIYDVNRDEIINFQDAGKCWVYITTPELHCEFGDLLYDVNCDGRVNFMDAGLIWVNRD